MTIRADATRGKSEGRRELAKAGVLEDQRRADIDRMTARVLPRLAAADEKTMSGAKLRKTHARREPGTV